MFQHGQFLVHNGVYLKNEKFNIQWNNRAFKYGDSLFESMMAHKGKLLWRELHYARLLGGMKALHYNVPADFTAENLENTILELLRKNKLFSTVSVRLQVFRSGGGKYTPESNHFDYIIEAEKFDKPLFLQQSEGLKVKIFPDVRKSFNLFSRLKTGNALLYVMASEYKRQKQCDDVIILNSDERVCEATASNIFVVKDNAIYTPPLNEACLDGVMRRVVIKLAKENDIPVTELPLRLIDVMRSDELFLTNATQGIRWVVALEKKRYYNNISKKLTELLQNKASE